MRTELTFLLAAVLVHAAIPLMARYAPSPSVESVGPRREVQALEVVEIPIERLDEPQRAPPPEPAIDPAAPPADARIARNTASTAPIPDGRERPTRGENPPGPVPTGPSVEPPSGAAAPKFGPADDGRNVLTLPGMSDKPIWSIPGAMPSAAPPAAAPTAPPPPRAVDRNIAGQVLAQGMRDNDKSAGLDLAAGGTVRSAVTSAVSASLEVPATARATFEVRLGADGRVLGVRVVTFNAGSADVWGKAARAVAGALGGQSLRMNDAYAKGALVYVDVSSKLQMPDGSAGGVIRPSGAGASFDVSNIGAHAHRHVSASFRTVAVR